MLYQENKCNPSFTFHYVSISTVSEGYNVEVIYIYIPLCIYFNLLERFPLSKGYSDLHSTMYLFQPAAAGITHKTYSHLHSTMYLFQQSKKAIQNLFQIHLHSTMYLFQHSDQHRYNLLLHHLHSTMYLFQH